MGKVLKDYRSLSANQKSMRRAIDNYKVVKKNNAQVNKKISTQPKRKLYLQMMENQKHEWIWFVKE